MKEKPQREQQPEIAQNAPPQAPAPPLNEEKVSEELPKSARSLTA